MRVIITGASRGIGRATAEYFLKRGHTVAGIDIKSSNLGLKYVEYEHYLADVSCKEWLPDTSCDILVNNAGIQEGEDVIGVNLQGVINCTEKYGLRPGICSILNVASLSAHNGAEFGDYTASKGGVLAYTKHVAQEVAKYGATCNSISPGGVKTSINNHILQDPEKYQEVLRETLLRKWASAKEIAEWIYFLTVVNSSVTGQDIIIDNGEYAKYNFVW